MKKNYKMVICYDGTRYYGWEHQPDRDTIQGKLENVLTRMCGEFIDVIGAGRTDAGVHAKAMTANAVMDTDFSPEEIRDYMNRYLPDDIAVREVREASERFHARYKAVGKLYCYTCFDGPVKPVFQRKYVTMLDYSPDVEKMRRAAAYLEGKHDYKSFCGNPRMKKSTVRNRIPAEYGTYPHRYASGGGQRKNTAGAHAGDSGSQRSSVGRTDSAAGRTLSGEGGLLTKILYGRIAAEK